VWREVLCHEFCNRAKRNGAEAPHLHKPVDGLRQCECAKSDFEERICGETRRVFAEGID